MRNNTNSRWRPANSATNAKLSSNGCRTTTASTSTKPHKKTPRPSSHQRAAENATTSSRDSVEREIADLRDQINQIGAVNLDALDELDELEARFGGLSQQYHDLVDAKAALERIIQRINVDSRQLFLATLETIRGHFRELFRQLFGGGEADIIIDETEDVLECGIDIVACPPGKEACNISLLSGGEKTLTCVALLLAVFRSKPSPFCILDEVDAALDEANIGRFIGVLRDFLSFTQFIVVTHSKKTMSGADTLYGITMEESGVSKHVSVRFEDVSEDGHILPSGLRNQSPPAIAAASDEAYPPRRLMLASPSALLPSLRRYQSRLLPRCVEFLCHAEEFALPRRFLREAEPFQPALPAGLSNLSKVPLPVLSKLTIGWAGFPRAALCVDRVKNWLAGGSLPTLSYQCVFATGRWSMKTTAVSKPLPACPHQDFARPVARARFDYPV